MNIAIHPVRHITHFNLVQYYDIGLGYGHQPSLAGGDPPIVSKRIWYIGKIPNWNRIVAAMWL